MHRGIGRKAPAPGSLLGDRQARVVHSFPLSLPRSLANSARICKVPVLCGPGPGGGTSHQSLWGSQHTETDPRQGHLRDQYARGQKDDRL